MSAIEIAGWLQGLVLIGTIVAGGAVLAPLAERWCLHRRQLDRSRRDRREQ